MRLCKGLHPLKVKNIQLHVNLAKGDIHRKTTRHETVKTKKGMQIRRRRRQQETWRQRHVIGWRHIPCASRCLCSCASDASAKTRRTCCKHLLSWHHAARDSERCHDKQGSYGDRNIHVGEFLTKLGEIHTPNNSSKFTFFRCPIQTFDESKELMAALHCTVWNPKQLFSTCTCS